MGAYSTSPASIGVTVEGLVTSGNRSAMISAFQVEGDAPTPGYLNQQEPFIRILGRYGNWRGFDVSRNQDLILCQRKHWPVRGWPLTERWATGVQQRARILQSNVLNTTARWDGDSSCPVKTWLKVPIICSNCTQVFVLPADMAWCINNPRDQWLGWTWNFWVCQPIAIHQLISIYYI